MIDPMKVTKIVWCFVTISLCTSVPIIENNQPFSEQETGDLSLVITLELNLFFYKKLCILEHF